MHRRLSVSVMDDSFHPPMQASDCAGRYAKGLALRLVQRAGQQLGVAGHVAQRWVDAVDGQLVAQLS